MAYHNSEQVYEPRFEPVSMITNMESISELAPVKVHCWSVQIVYWIKQ